MAKPTDLRFVLAVSVYAVAGCSFPVASPDPVAVEDTSTTLEPIIGGTLTTSYPEAALLNMQSSTGATYACSAALIAPRVVLTAGHCVDTMVSWEVTVAGVSVASSHGETYDWNEAGSSTVNPNHHDIGLVYLDKPIALSSYPTIALRPAAAGTQVIDVGRINSGVLTNAIYRAPVTVKSAASVGFPLDYVSSDVIEHGDSGGPVFLPSSHTIVAVNSGANGAIEVLARVDLLASWLTQRIAMAAAGAGATPAPLGPGTGTNPSAPPPAPVDAGSPAEAGARPGAGPTSPSSPSAGACVSEVEPNDTVAHANPLASKACGAIGGATDVDWFVFTPSVGTTQVLLTATKDASLSVGYLTSPTTCGLVVPASARSTGVKITVGAGALQPQPVCVLVSSPSHALQSYTLTATH